MSPVGSDKGYTLIEMVMVIVIIGTLATVATKSMRNVTDLTRTEETKEEMDRLAHAITGNPALVSGGIRVDYGYIGDIGALPGSWDDLVTSPGYSTWNGPYIEDEFAPGTGNNLFKYDAWGALYSSPNSSGFSSTGGPEIITRKIANSIGDVLYNSVILSITDLDLTLPGESYKDSVRFLFTYPDGSGSTVTETRYTNTNGLVRFDSIPIGIHTLRVVFLSSNDTLTRKINIDPGKDYHNNIPHFADIW
jgi:prepilin-type N-terminal cleavage/methylation domain-containing protein